MCNLCLQGSGTSHTVYKGNKRPCQKECVLIIDHKTGEITLERLAADLRLKKTRYVRKKKGLLYDDKKMVHVLAIIC